MKIKDFFLKIGHKTLDILYPNNIKCILCGEELSDTNYPICDECKKQHIYNTGNRCCKCDMEILEGNIICDHCKTNKRHFDRCLCPLNYDGLVRKSILTFKSENARYLAPIFAKLMADYLESEKVVFDIIVPVPSHKKTIRKRGFNPASLLATEISKLTGKPLCDILEKNVFTKNQKRLNFIERQENIKNTIVINDKKVVKGKNVLIVDDIITTCATVDVCASLMKGALSITCVGIARTNL